MLNTILNKLIDESIKVKNFPITSPDSTVKSVLKTISKFDSNISSKIQRMIKEMKPFFDEFYQKKEDLLRLSNEIRNGKEESRSELLQTLDLLYTNTQTISEHNKEVIEGISKFRDQVSADLGALKQLEIKTKAQVKGLQTIVEEKKKLLKSKTAIIIATSFIPLIHLIAEIASLVKNKKLLEQELHDLSEELKNSTHEISQLIIFVNQVYQFESSVDILLSSTQNLVVSVQILQNYLKETMRDIEKSSNMKLPVLIEAYLNSTENMIIQLEEYIQ